MNNKTSFPATEIAVSLVFLLMIALHPEIFPLALVSGIASAIVIISLLVFYSGRNQKPKPAPTPERAKRHTVKVKFSDGSFRETDINGTAQTIAEYYAIGNSFNLGNSNDNIQHVISLEFIK